MHRDGQTRPPYLPPEKPVSMFKKQHLEWDMEQWADSKLGKDYVNTVYCHPAYLTYTQITSCKMPGWMKSQTGIKIARRNINNLRYADDTTLTAESKEVPKSHLMKVKEESEKAGLKLNIQKTKITHPFPPIISWQIDRGKMETVRDFILLGSKTTADSDCSRETKKMHAPWKKSYDKSRQHIEKERQHFANKRPYSQSSGFSSIPVWI